MTPSERNVRRDRGWYKGIQSTLPYVLRFSLAWIVVSVAALLVAGGSSFMLMSESVPEAEQSRLIVILLLQTGGVLIALLILAFSTTHRLVEPFLAIQRACLDVSHGDLKRRIRFRSQDRHLRDLESSFNEMMTVLEEKAGGTKGEDPI